MMRMGWQSKTKSNADAQLFHKFTLKAVFSRLSIINLATGELPFERQAHDLAALHAENLSALLNDRAGNMQMFHSR
jgi:hypothetical protein